LHLYIFYENFLFIEGSMGIFYDRDETMVTLPFFIDTAAGML